MILRQFTMLLPVDVIKTTLILIYIVVLLKFYIFMTSLKLFKVTMKILLHNNIKLKLTAALTNY